MKSLLTPAIYLLAAASLAFAAPVGICLHAYSPEAPADKIECFEFDSLERAGSDYRFFIDANKPAVITSYRYRGAIPYKPGLAPGNPEFDKLLKLYEETSRATPSTRRYLNPKILAMRDQVNATASRKEELAKLPNITLPDGTVLEGCKVSKIDGQSVSLLHADGIKNVKISDLNKETLKALGLDLPPAQLVDSSSAKMNDTTQSPVKKTVTEEPPLKTEIIPKEQAKAKEGDELNPTDPNAQIALAKKYAEGDGVTKDGEESIKWLTKAAEQDSVEAQYGLGCFYAYDDKLRNEFEAVKWITRAVDKGYGPALVELGLFYKLGVGVKQDPEQALSWFHKASKVGDASADAWIAECYHYGTGVAKNPSLALTWYLKAGNNGSGHAQWSLYQFYNEGDDSGGGLKGVSKDPKEAHFWLCKAADNGNTSAQCNLAICYANGDIIPKNEQEAAKWFRKAADGNHAYSMSILGLCYQYGFGVPKDIQESKEWTLKAEEAGENDVPEVIKQLIKK